METPRLTRTEGYKKSSGKEQQGLDVFSGFLQEKFDLPAVPITGYENNYRFGDFRINGNVTIEVKSQPIDPYKYTNNFVEVFEQTWNPLHQGGFHLFEDGFGLLGKYMKMSEDELEQVLVSSDGKKSRLGRPQFMSISITSIVGSQFTAYVNQRDGGAHIYLYERKEILQNIWHGIQKGLVRGAGNSNEDTFGVFVPLPRWRWERTPDGWLFVGDQEPSRNDLTLS